MNTMYEKALQIARKNIRGGASEPFFRRPFIDAAFSSNIFLWDSCFLAGWAKYHLDEFPIRQSLDNFYALQEKDGFICREYCEDGKPTWPKNHPISVNPPLLSWAELELYSKEQETERLKRVYPALKKNYHFLFRMFRKEDGLFFHDSLGSGMDNIDRFPYDWDRTDPGIRICGNDPRFDGLAEGLNRNRAIWNIQGRAVDFSCQNALNALCLKKIAEIIGEKKDIAGFDNDHKTIASALNEWCWDPEKAFFFDLGYGEQIPRFHIGMYWALLAQVVSPQNIESFVAHLEDPRKFGRPTPFPSLSADDPNYKGWGDYWNGGVWAPTSYMVLLGLREAGKHQLAQRLAERLYAAVETVFKATGTFWENYAPEMASYGRPAKPEFCGWTALVPIAVYREFLS
jgi:hypothetical protein